MANLFIAVFGVIERAHPTRAMDFTLVKFAVTSTIPTMSFINDMSFTCDMLSTLIAIISSISFYGHPSNIYFEILLATPEAA